MKTQEQWGSRIGVILAVAGSAVGLGNFLRFPGQVAQHGGGAFMIPYFTALLVLGIPLCWAEWTMGRYGGTRGFNSAPGIFTVIWRHPLAKYFGCLALLIPLVIYMYYLLIEAWCLTYAIQYLMNDLAVPQGGTYETHFNALVGMDQNGDVFRSSNGLMLGAICVTFAMNFVLIYRGVSKGIEAFCRWAMPLMAILALIVLVRVLTLGTPDPALPERSLVNGLGFMWNPDFSKLSNAESWMAAAGQIFFSLSVGFGIIINYASYLKERDDVVLSGLTSCSVNEFFEVCLGGLITIPAAFIFLGEAVGSQSTFGLGFVSLPEVFQAMPFGRVVGCLWFVTLFVAAITSSVSMLQPVIAFLEEGLGLRRHASTSLLGIIAGAGTLFSAYFSQNLVALNTLDFWVGTFLIYVLAMFQSILYGWVMGIDMGAKEAARGAAMRIPYFVQLMLKFVVPVYLLTIFVAFCYQNFEKHVDEASKNVETMTSMGRMASIGMMGGIAVMLFLGAFVAGRRWDREGRFDRI